MRTAWQKNDRRVMCDSRLDDVGGKAHDARWGKKKCLNVHQSLSGIKKRDWTTSRSLRIDCERKERAGRDPETIAGTPNRK